LLRKGAKKQQHSTTAFKKLFKSVDKGCIILMSVEPVKPLSWVSYIHVELLIWDGALPSTVLRQAQDASSGHRLF
jgi:hypothetical protein